MIAALVAWTVALTSIIYPIRQRALFAIPLGIAVLVFLVTVVVVAYAPAAEYVAGKDRDIYEVLYERLTWSDFSFSFEPAYTALQVAGNSLGLNAGAFFALICTFVLTALIVFLTSRYDLVGALFLLFLIVNFFAFTQASHATRQFIAIGVLLLSFPLFSRALKSGSTDYAAILGMFGALAVAAAFHRSSLFLVPPLALAIFGMGTRSFMLLGSALFVVNLAGLGPSIWEPIIALDKNASENLWSFERGEIGLIYSGGVNRIDFFLFTMLPLLGHEIWKPIAPKNASWRDTDVLSLFYACLIFPFFALSFLPYSDRLALAGWVIWPVALCDLAMRDDRLSARLFVLFAGLAIAVVAIFRLYGLTATQMVQDLLW